jgi:hypothetical protein
MRGRVASLNAAAARRRASYLRASARTRREPVNEDRRTRRSRRGRDLRVPSGVRVSKTSPTSRSRSMRWPPGIETAILITAAVVLFRRGVCSPSSMVVRLLPFASSREGLLGLGRPRRYSCSCTAPCKAVAGVFVAAAAAERAVARDRSRCRGDRTRHPPRVLDAPRAVSSRSC